ncbi:MAG: aminotransferase class I/II-fold pyridoxal phosphate-dependent enzyme [Acidimicrobiia bacterium]|nr:aminotransferase class I/II-fold pyridoxal phosphate-dependent enzyme [Acidimicrobiia bacterium]
MAAEIEILGIDDLRSLSGIKWNKFPSDVLAAWVADMDVRPPPCVNRALAELVDRADFGYNRRASELLADTFARWQLESHGWSPPTEEVRVFCDVLQAIDVALWLHTDPGDGIILLTPIYPPFIRAVDGAGRRIIDVPLDPDGWRLDPARLRAAVDGDTRAVLLCSPHNPTGRVFDRDELTAIAEVANEHDLLVVSDEVWADLVHPGATHVPLASIGDEVAARTVTVSSASKAFNLAGLRCAVAHVGHAGVAARLDALPGHLLGAVGTPGAEAAIAAWTDGRDWLAALRRHLTARRDQLARRLATELPRVGFDSPEATYLAWLDFRELGLGDDPSARLLDLARVALGSGPDFGPRGNGFGRLNFATSEDLLDDMLDRLVSAINA